MTVRRFATPEQHIAPVDDRPVLPKTQPNHPFLLSHHPMSWQFAADAMDPERDEWLPLLSQSVVAPGVNGVGDDRSPAPLQAHLAAKGHTILAPGDSRLGELRHYDRYWYECEWNGRRGRYYCLPFQGFSAVGKVVRPRVDEAGHRAWLRSLVESGAVEPMPDVAFEAGLAGHDEEMKLKRQRSLTGAPAAVKDLDAAESRRARMVAAWERMQAQDEASPTSGPSHRLASAGSSVPRPPRRRGGLPGVEHGA